MTQSFTCFDSEVSVQAARQILDGKVYQLLEGIGEINVIVDIGANIGAASVYLKDAYPDAALYAFEPSKASFELLQRNLSALSNIHLYNFGLHELDATTRLYRGKLDGISDSVIPGLEVTDEYFEVELKSAAGELRRLHLQDIDILKIDTEGCEVPVLRTMVKWLAGIKVIYLEYHSELDRQLIDLILRRTHVLYASRATNPHRGELTYISSTLEPLCCYDLIEHG
ncbi:MAG: FkbM family methyltransferase [Trichlorobacter sp.]|uniref:FkbM family methyltransferase n=1 Tax=Trichlorobacter sp. TaxID=2911007 RepID=UPI002567209F|nr:FkbM family methyltransferase [Trichlorobacter sp.]MDK9717041.1 FkbM family methyltransferase [Trichlorobacter sp.]